VIRWSLALVLLTSCATTTPLTSTIDRAAAQPPLDRAIWGIVVEDDTGRTLYSRNAHTLLVPASNRKLFSASSAVNCFTINHQFATELWLDGANVVIRGGGDPSLGGRWSFDRDVDFAPFIDALRTRGIAAIDDIIADVSLFDRTTEPPSWKIGYLSGGDISPVDALAYNENVVGVSIANCSKPTIDTDPIFVPAIANVMCGAGEPDVQSDPSNALTVVGTMPDRYQGLTSVSDPALYAAQALRDALRHAGIVVRGVPRVNTIARPWQEKIAEVDSPLFVQLLATMLKVSHNVYAEMLFKGTALSGAPAPSPASYERAEDLERSFLVTEVGVDPNEFRFLDGSGLSPDDLVTPAAIVQLLRWMNAPQRRGFFWSVLATPGEEGTLRRRLLPLAQRLRGKTGTLRGVNALSGIIAGEHGRFRYFSIIVNHHLAESATAAIDEMVAAIADF
jgi:D-alanyl-D-alanine carboxypeptidase/D-alanyl-D-alanine-endopeptidase (penicillin-binding protein 4)